MNTFESFLDARDARKKADAEDAPKARLDWALVHADPAERLMAFDHWVREQIERRLVWQPNDANKERCVYQCRVELEHMLTQLYSRGWLLDGQRLARHVTTILDAVGAAQRAGKVRDFWPYFKAAVTRYVGTNAEELQAENKRAGNLMAGVLGGLGIMKGNSMVELIATRRSEIVEEKKTLREQVSAARAEKAACKRDADQLPLL